MSTSKREAEVEQVVGDLIRRGRLTYAQRQPALAYAKVDPDAFKLFVEASPGSPYRSAGEELLDLTMRRMEDENIGYKEALRAVCEEHPDLEAAYQAEGRRR